MNRPNAPRRVSPRRPPLQEAQDLVRADLAAQLEARVQWAEQGKKEGSPEMALATHLRSLAAQLTRPNDDPTTG